MPNIERLQRLVDFLKVLPDDKFHMEIFFTLRYDMPYLYLTGELDQNIKEELPLSEVVHKCGTAACIAGWAAVLMIEEKSKIIPVYGTNKDYLYTDMVEVANWLGIGEYYGDRLFYGNWIDKRLEEITKGDAIMALENMISRNADGPEFIVTRESAQ